jgi:hypothetical protein
MVALETLPASPGSHSTGSASTAVWACQKLSAMTATPESPTCTTFFTPGMPATLAASKLFTVPVRTGQSRIAAMSIPGILRSMP